MSPLEATLAVPVHEPAIAPVPRPSAPRRPRVDVEPLLADLHARHAEELLRFCRWMLKDPDDACDAVQDTWMRAMSALRDDRIRVAALRPWLYTIARNVCLDRIRDRKRASVHELDESDLGETPGADEVVAMRQEAGAALALVGTLSERQRSALLMRELAGMEMPDIAHALGVTVDRAAWAVADARKALGETRAGTNLDCSDARARLGAGHRGRTLRAHLGQCKECAAHDRTLRARRVLAPALVPFLWLRRLGWPAFLKPAAATVIVAIGAGAMVVVPATEPAAGDRPARAAAAPPRAAASLALPAAAAPTARPTASARRPASARAAAPAASTASRPSVTAPARTAAAPAVATAAAASGATAAPAVPLQRVTDAVAATVPRVLGAVARTAAPVPVAGPVVTRVTQVATAVAGRLHLAG